MQVTTNITRFDLLAFNLYVIPRMRSTYITGIVFALLCFAFLVWKDGSPCTKADWVKYSIISVSSGLGAMIGGSVFSLIGILFMSSKTNGILGAHHYELLESGLLEKTDANEGLSKWQGIAEISESKNYILFRIAGHLFHIIPRRCFLNEPEGELFLTNAKAHWEKAHNKASNPTP